MSQVWREDDVRCQTSVPPHLTDWRQVRQLSRPQVRQSVWLIRIESCLFEQIHPGSLFFFKTCIFRRILWKPFRSRTWPGPVPGPWTSTNKTRARERKEGKGREGRKEGKERGREGTDLPAVRKGADLRRGWLDRSIYGQGREENKRLIGGRERRGTGKKRRGNGTKESHGQQWLEFVSLISHHKVKEAWAAADSFVKMWMVQERMACVQRPTSSCWGCWGQRHRERKTCRFSASHSDVLETTTSSGDRVDSRAECACWPQTALWATVSSSSQTMSWRAWRWCWHQDHRQ